MGSRFILSALLFCAVLSATAQSRREFLLEKNWKFSRNDTPEAVRPAFDDSKWQTVDVPHDWAIYGPFDGNADVQNVTIVQDGETRPTMKAGRTGGLPFIGTGWYRTHFDADGFGKGQKATILFDGAMSNARVYLNGHEIGHWAYGYNSFWFDMTPYIRDKDNVLAVRLENLPESSRWYPGAGIYRNVHVIITSDTHIPVWGAQITASEVTPDFARINMKIKIETPANKKNLMLEAEIKNMSNDVIYTFKAKDIQPLNSIPHECIADIRPELWSPSNPYLYTAVFKIYDGDVLKDEYSVRFGVRKLEIVPDKGMFLNGKPIKFRGVCNHHDLGPLGAAVNTSALRRQLTLLKDMGCNAIRTSHNMPAPELVSLCDEMGFMVMVEPFDEWNVRKCANGYHRYFDEWAEKDMVNMIHNFRNNPSVVMWSIGNEVAGQGTPKVLKTAKFLQDICHREDPTRPVTMGIDMAEASIDSHLAAILDVVGFTYRLPFYKKAYNELPQNIVLGSETVSAFSSRGTYHFPVVRAGNKLHDDSQCSSYDVEHANWSNLPEDDFIHHDDYPWCIGEFVWTGFDYLGEPTPYYSNWPNHSSMFGIIDLAGMPKDRYYLYRSHWNPDAETLHILPHWSWNGREGEITPVFVYTNYPTAELFINGKSQGRISKDTAIKADISENSDTTGTFIRQRRYRLMWMDVKYEPGTVKVVAYDSKGNAVAEREMRTAGKPHRIELTADRDTLVADGKDLVFITAAVVDKDGNLCPEASNSLQFKVSGAGKFRAAANGDPTSLEIFHHPQMQAFKGKLVLIVQSTEKHGVINISVSSKGLQKGERILVAN